MKVLFHICNYDTYINKPEVKSNSFGCQNFSDKNVLVAITETKIYTKVQTLIHIFFFPRHSQCASRHRKREKEQALYKHTKS